MPLIPFVNKEVISELEKIESNENDKSIFPEHEFVASCLRIGLTISDLKQMTYVDALKIMLSFIKVNNNIKEKNATQRDIDRLLGG